MPLDRAAHLRVDPALPDPVAPLEIHPGPGRMIGLVGGPGSGMTRLALSLLAGHPGMTAFLDVRGWLCPLAAWEVGVDPERLVIVRSPERTTWAKVAATLLEGFPLVCAEVPAHVPDADLRRLAALARARRTGVILRPLTGDLPAGVLHLRLEATAVRWEGVDRGHGTLMRRHLTLRASGKGARGGEQFVEVEDDGTHPLRVVPRLAVAPAGLAAG